VCHVSLPSSYRSWRGHIHLLRVLPLVGCWSKTPTVLSQELRPGTLADGVGELRLGTLLLVWRCEEEDVDFNAMVQTTKHGSVFISSLDSI
jgi:hypothetical protein